MLNEMLDPLGGTYYYYDDLSPYKVNACALVGSKFVNPTGKPNDEDHLVLLQWDNTWTLCEGEESNGYSWIKHVRGHLESKGWVCNSTYDQERWEEPPFLTARKDHINFILYIDPIGYGLFLGAARICKALRVYEKQTRVDLHCIATEHKGCDTYQGNYGVVHEQP